MITHSFVLDLFIFAFGAIIGSFLNALIYRIPNGISIAEPRSKCPSCNKVIYWFENIPIFSFLFLRGKCSECGAKIGYRYLIVEIIMAVFAVLIFPKSLTLLALSKYFLKISVFACFVIHFFIDLKHKILPNSVNIYLALCLLALAVLDYNWKHILIGGSVGFLFPFIITWAFYMLRGQIGLGGGDIKLFGALGLYFGPVGILFNLFVSCFLGALISLGLIGLKKMSKDNPIAFGPFIILTSIAQLFFPLEFNKLISFFFVGS